MRSRLHEVGELGRVQPPQLAEGYLQARRRHMGDERLDLGPVDDPARLDPAAEHAGQGRRSTGRELVSTPMTCHWRPVRASSISLARTRRAPSRWMR